MCINAGYVWTNLFCCPLWARGIYPALACEIELKPEHYHIAERLQELRQQG